MLAGVVPALVVVVRDATGAVRFSGLLVTVPSMVARATGDDALTLDLRGSAPVWDLVVGDRRAAAPPQRLRLSQTATVGDLRLTFQSVEAVPAVELADVPGFPGGAVAQMPALGSGGTWLIVAGGAQEPAVLAAGGGSSRIGGLEYTFDGRRNVAALTVRRDPGTGLVWMAVGLLTAGLAVTFYVPRRRLWLRLTPGRLAVAGEARPATDLPAEVERLLGLSGATARAAMATGRYET
ncbi:MAG: cytochrome c biogenesis protein ResB [Dehalococcoidia bacterium]